MKCQKYKLFLHRETFIPTYFKRFKDFYSTFGYDCSWVDDATEDDGEQGP